ncbi:hypothetical protein BRX37_16660 [Sphingomonas sp. S-NIH.Pt3_0716]|nr:hypothetical protein BRX37_16660 [Sphingomonas sp. S-NIH.Pt3_0716]
MSIEYIQRRYSVPAQIGGRVVYSGCGYDQPGTIVDADSGRLRIQLDDTPDYVGLYHPTWELIYLDADNEPVSGRE